MFSSLSKTLHYSLIAALLCLFSLSSSSLFAQGANSPYEKDMQRFEKENADNPPTQETTFFVGSSTFTIWKEIPDDFQEFHAVNRGFGGSQITDWLNFACDRVLVDYKPRHIVFFCGCNDIAVGKSAEETFANFKKFLNKMRDANPNLTLHFCALHMPPVREKNWEAFRQFNAEAKALADIDPNIYYIDFAAATSNENGGGREDLFQKDRLHLTRDGEKVLIPLIKESLQKAQNDAAAKRNNTLSGAVKGEPLQNGVAETLQLPTTIDFNKWSLSLSEQDDVVLLQLHQIEDGKKKTSLLKRVYHA